LAKKSITLLGCHPRGNGRRHVVDRPTTRNGFALAIIAGALLTGCAGSGPASPSASTTVAEPSGPQSVGTVVITEADCTFQPSADQLRPGAAELSVTNNTDGVAGVHLWRIIDGHTYDELAAHVAEEVRLAQAGEPGLGHPDFVADLVEVVADAGNSASATGTLRVATYGLVCARLSETASQRGPFKTIGPIEVK
jgi:hypothetical protein